MEAVATRDPNDDEAVVMVPLTDDVRTKARAKVLNNEKLKAEDLKH